MLNAMYRHNLLTRKALAALARFYAVQEDFARTLEKRRHLDDAVRRLLAKARRVARGDGAQARTAHKEFRRDRGGRTLGG
jgi:hypothetical protein